MIQLFQNWYIQSVNHKIIGWTILLIGTIFLIWVVGFPPEPWLILLQSTLHIQNLWGLLNYKLIIPFIGVVFLSFVILSSYILIPVTALLMSIWITDSSKKNDAVSTEKNSAVSTESAKTFMDLPTQIINNLAQDELLTNKSFSKQGIEAQQTPQNQTLRKEQTQSLPKQQTQTSRKKQTQSLPKQQTQSLPKQQTQSLPKQQTQSLPKQQTQSEQSVIDNDWLNSATQPLHKLQTDSNVSQESNFYFWVDQATDSYKFDLIAPPQFLVFDALSDPGIKRKHKPNEDSVFALIGVRSESVQPQQFGLFIVADGMGGQARGQDASHFAIEQIGTTVLACLLTGTDDSDDFYAQLLVDGIQIANQVIQKENFEKEQDMGCTVTAALVINDTAYVANIGDSRTYLFNWKKGLLQITIDHSVVAEYVARGEIKPDDIYTHPERNKITRCLGDHSPVDVDIFAAPIDPGDALLLCSDGLWEMIRDPEIESILTKSMTQPNYAAKSLIQTANKAGGVDNISAIIAYSPKKRSS